MKKYTFSLIGFVLGTFLSLTSCVSDELAQIGDLPDLTGPTPFYNFTDITTSKFDCNDVELSANYQINFQAGSNLAVNGTKYQWAVTPNTGVTLINPQLPILRQTIDGALGTIRGLESEIAKLEFRIPCEPLPAKVAVFQSQITDLKAKLVTANNSLTTAVKANVASLEAQIAALPAATLQDQELIISFPGPGTYKIALTVTDNLGKFATTEKDITINQVVATIPIPEIGEASFELNDLFDGTGDGRDSWRSPSSARWGTIFQTNNNRPLGELPDGTQAAKFPPDGTRSGYQEIEVTPGATYVLTYFTEFRDNVFGDLTVSIIRTTANSRADAQLAANIIATRTDTNVGRTQGVFKKHALTFSAGEEESVIIYITNNPGAESRLDAFEISVKQ